MPANSNSTPIAIVVLAAGASTRMGEPKQLLPYSSGTLLTHTIGQAINSQANQVIIVLGANSEMIKPTIINKSVQIIENPSWQLGMASSIACGVKALPADSQAVILTTSDQPHLSATVINQLIETHIHTEKPIVCAKYSQTLGVPALFSREFFPQLRGLEGSKGAREIIMRHVDLVATIEFPQGAIDIDTPLDYRKLKQEIKA